jgi:CHAT domain-containing protein
MLEMELKSDLVACPMEQRGVDARTDGAAESALCWAFAAAGVGSELISRWRPDADSTAAFYRAFYASMLTRKSSPARAFVDASMAVRRLHGPAIQPTTNARTQSNRDHPYYWAGYVLCGDWR